MPATAASAPAAATSRYMPSHSAPRRAGPNGGSEVIRAHGDGPARDAGVVVPGVGVPDALVVDDRSGCLPAKGRVTDRRPRRALVHVDALRVALDQAVLDHVVGAGRLSAPGGIRPLAVDAGADAGADVDVPERRTGGEVLHVD